MAIIIDKINQIRQAIFGKDVRESIASGIEEMNKEVESTTGKQKHLEDTFNQLVINAGSSNAEIVDARVDKTTGKSYTKVGERLDEVSSHLADIPNKTYITEKAKTVDVNNALLIKADKNYVDTITQSLASGSPKGTFSTLALLQVDVTANTTEGKKCIYVVTADGGWYYWNGSAWTKGGTYQSTGIEEQSIVLNKINYNQINEFLTSDNFKLISIQAKKGEYSPSQNSWKLDTDSTNKKIYTFSDYYPLPDDDFAIKSLINNYLYNIYYFNESKTLLANDINISIDEKILPKGIKKYNQLVKYIIVEMKNSDGTSPDLEEVKKNVIYYKGVKETRPTKKKVIRGLQTIKITNGVGGRKIREIAIAGYTSGGNGTVEMPNSIRYAGEVNSRVRMTTKDNLNAIYQHDIPTTLLSFEGHCDKVFLDTDDTYKVRKELGLVTYNGSTLQSAGTAGEYNRYSVSYASIGIATPKPDSKMLSNYFIYDGNYYGAFEHFQWATNGYLYFYSKKTLSEIQALFNSNPLQILFVRNTPTITALSAAVNEQIKSIIISKNSTIITSSDESKPYITVEYLAYDVIDNSANLHMVESEETGDCTIIAHDDGTVGMIDTKRAEDSKYVIEYLKRLNVKELSYIIISHYHRDHVANLGVIADLVDTTKCECYLPPDPDFTILKQLFPTDPTPTSYETAKNTLTTRYGVIKYPKEREVVKLGEAYFEFFNTNHDYLYVTTDHNYNDFSLCCYMDIGNTVVLFTGDLATKGQNKYAGNLRKCNLYKAHHHSVDQNFLNFKYMSSVNPDVVITIGGKKEHSWITTSMLQQWCENNRVSNYLTDTNGSITINVSGNGWKIISNVNRFIINE